MRRVVVTPGRVRMPVVADVRSVRGAWLLVAVLAVLGAVVGGGLLVRDRLAGQSLPDTATLGGLTARLHDAGWLSMEMHQTSQGGYQMPAQMMPGAPPGDELRLGVPVTLINTGRETRAFSLVDEFFLAGGRITSPRGLQSDTFGPLPRLGPGSAVDGTIYFDTVVPSESDPPLYLIWRRGGETVQLAIPRISNAPDHPHGE